MILNRLRLLQYLPLLVISAISSAEEPQDIFSVITQFAEDMSSIKTLIVYFGGVIGLAMLFAGLLKLKQHKDNPTQVPIGTPLVLMAIASLMIFLSSLTQVAEDTFFDASTST